MTNREMQIQRSVSRCDMTTEAKKNTTDNRAKNSPLTCFFGLRRQLLPIMIVVLAHGVEQLVYSR